MLIHFYLTGCQALSETESADLTEELLDLAAGWGQRLHLALTETCGAEKAEGLAIKYAHAFEDMYRRKTSPTQAAQDIQMLEAVGESSRVLVDVVQDDRDQVRLRMYQLHNILLSEMLPVLDNFGLIVLDQFSDLSPSPTAPSTRSTPLGSMGLRAVGHPPPSSSAPTTWWTHWKRYSPDR